MVSEPHDTQARLLGFQEDWLARLSDVGPVRLAFEPRPSRDGSPAAIADGFVKALGLTPIGFNWELLDPGHDPDAERSGYAEMTAAISQDIANPSQRRLPIATAQACAAQFLGCFDPWRRTVLSNRYDGLWNPISGAEVEWGFVAFDEAEIALLLFTDR